MSKKKSLSFYTNMPTPYQMDFFNSLSNLFDLKVIYFSDVERDRLWKMRSDVGKYEVIQLNDNFIARIIQRSIVSFHFDWKIRKVLKSDLSDFVIVNGTYWSPNTILSLLHSHKNRKKVFFFSEPVFTASNTFTYWTKWLLLTFVRKCTDGLMGIGVEALESFKTYGYKKPMYNVPYSIDISCFDKENVEKQKAELFLKKYNPLNKILILSSGSLIKRKGMDILINAFKSAYNNGAAKLLIIGDGPQKAYLQNLSNDGSDIELAGFMDSKDIPYLFNMADIFAFASKYDGWALVINEAIAARLPIICSNKVGAAIDKIKDGVNGMLFDPQDTDTLCKRLATLISDKAERSRLSHNVDMIRYSISSQYNAEIVYGIC